MLFSRIAALHFVEFDYIIVQTKIDKKRFCGGSRIVFYVYIYYYEVLVWREFICNKSMIIGGGEIRELL
jgi:hypothetical protein